MWILIAEMLLALGIIVFIMWWTMRARVDHAAPDEQTSTQEVKETEHASGTLASKTHVDNEGSPKG